MSTKPRALKRADVERMYGVAIRDAREMARDSRGRARERACLIAERGEPLREIARATTLTTLRDALASTRAETKETPCDTTTSASDVGAIGSTIPPTEPDAPAAGSVTAIAPASSSPSPSQPESQDDPPVGSRVRYSKSGIAMYMRCGEQYRRRYLLGERRPPGVAAKVGHGVHRGVEMDLRAKLATATLLSLDEHAAITRDAVVKSWAEEAPDLAALDPEERARGTAALQGDAIDKAIRLGAAHHSVLAPTIYPVALEEHYVAELAGMGLDFDLHGIVDIEEAHGLRDTKTSGKSPVANAADESIELTHYAVLKRAVDGRTPDRVSLDTLVALKSGPKVVTSESRRRDTDIRSYLSRVQVIHEAIQRGVFVPADPQHWACSAKFCGYFEDCPFGRAGRVQA
jgi:hypothetical protein